MITIRQAQTLYDQADTAHDFDHVLRVLALAERIGRAEGADMAIVRAAVLLHDVGRIQAEHEHVDHAAFAADRAAKILTDQPLEVVRAVKHAIAAHRYRSEPSPQTLEAKVVYDADKLDAIGAVGIARAYAYGGAHNQRIWAPREEIDLDRWIRQGDDPTHHTPVHEFVVKLSRIADKLYTSTGHAIAEERHAFMSAFFERLAAEVRGDK